MGIGTFGVDVPHGVRCLTDPGDRTALLELSARAGLTHEAISALEHGKRAASAPTVRQLSQALGVAPAQFVADTPIGLEMLSTQEAGRRLDVPGGRVRFWLKHGVLPGRKVSGRWRIPAIAVSVRYPGEEMSHDSHYLTTTHRIDGRTAAQGPRGEELGPD